MRVYGLLTLGLAASFLALFAVAQALRVPLLVDPRPYLHGAGLAAAAALGVGLLVADVALPVPSSVVMVAHGAVFGAFGGTLVSLLGAMGGAAAAFGVGRWGSAALHRRVAADERRRADALLARWGVLAVLATRPVPILAESVALLAGTSPLPWPRFLAAAFLGNLPAAALYAVAGAAAAQLAAVGGG